ncbi:hypothetical protein H7X46_22355 [Pseudonocardia sp. C8]|uniref:ATP-binding protein n=1 Tax=Pseudonocardia sp. C8 TaxID=2762759 RepID=UPI0016430D7F|nr:ATP-binding protein [Pseudonocardia sp. C8]MBC3193807.1 hypothetical protein [Pseudonocardia sp. C8]
MHLPTRRAIAGYFPRGYALSDEDWARRHRIVLGVLIGHIPALVLFALFLGWGLESALLAAGGPALCAVLARVLSGRRRLASGLATLGLVTCSVTLVALTHGTIEAHFHFFIIIGFIALYQDWIPFLLNFAITVLSHGFGSALHGSMVFNHHAAQMSPWTWSAIHGVAVAFACTATMVFWRISEEQQQERQAIAAELTEMNRRRFTADLLVNLARRNQSMLYRQADIINQLEESERDPDTLAELFVLDHLTTRVRRNSESLLVLSGEAPSRMWSRPVPLRDVVRAAIAETEELERVTFTVDEHTAVLGHTVTDITHMLAELTENAVRFSPPDSTVVIRARPDRTTPGGHVLTVEDCGVGMPDDDLAAANELLADPPEVDLSVANRLGFHVVARLAGRHGIRVTLGRTPGSGITAVIAMPNSVFAPVSGPDVDADQGVPAPEPPVARAAATPTGPGTRVTGIGRSPAGDHGDPVAAGDPIATGPVAFAGGTAASTTGSTGSITGSVTGSVTGATASGTGASGTPAGPAPTRVPDFGHPGPGWTGWWDGAPQEPAARPSPVPRPRPQAGNPAPVPAQRSAEAPPVPASLRRRVPQASIAPELREPGAADGWGESSGSHALPALSSDRAAEAAQALSRFQARRDAARAEVGHDPAVRARGDGIRS